MPMLSFGGQARERPRVNLGGGRVAPQSREELLRRAEANRQLREQERRRVAAANLLARAFRARCQRIAAMDELRCVFDQLDPSDQSSALLRLRLLLFFFDPRTDVTRFISLYQIDNARALVHDWCQDSTESQIGRLIKCARLCSCALTPEQHYRLCEMLSKWQDGRRFPDKKTQWGTFRLLEMELDRLSEGYSGSGANPWDEALKWQMPQWLRWPYDGSDDPDMVKHVFETVFSVMLASGLPGFLTLQNLGLDRVLQMCRTVANFSPRASQVQPEPCYHRRFASSWQWSLANFSKLALNAWTQLATSSNWSHVALPCEWAQAVANSLYRSIFSFEKEWDDQPLDEWGTSAAWIEANVPIGMLDIFIFLARPDTVDKLWATLDLCSVVEILMAVIDGWPAEREQLLTQLAQRALSKPTFLPELYRHARDTARDRGSSFWSFRVSDKSKRPERFLIEVCHRVYITMPDRDFFDPARNPLPLDDLHQLVEDMNDQLLKPSQPDRSAKQGYRTQRLGARFVHHLVMRFSRQPGAKLDEWVLLKGESETERFLTNAFNDARRLAEAEDEVMDDADADTDVRKTRSFEDFSTATRVLTQCPWTVRFEDRLSLLRDYIHEDAEANGYSLVYRQALSRLPVPVRREHELEDGFKALWPVNAGIKQPLSVHYQDVFGMEESGIDGGGLTKEFLVEACKQAFDPDQGLFVETADHRLYPASGTTASQRYNMYEFIGRMIGKCVVEGILVDVSFANFFLLRWIGKSSHLDDLQALDRELYNGLLKLKDYPGDVEQDFALDFTLTEKLGEPPVNLIRHGGDTAVTRANRLQYIHLVCHYKLNVRYQKQADAFARGLQAVLNANWLSMFLPYELQAMVGGDPVPIDVANLKQYTAYGLYSERDETVQLFWQVLEHRFTEQERELFVKFVTSTPRPPLMGFSRLQPHFGIQRAGTDITRLPSASTCINLLKLPDYKDAALLEEKLRLAITGHAGFDLS